MITVPTVQILREEDQGESKVEPIWQQKVWRVSESVYMLMVGWYLWTDWLFDMTHDESDYFAKIETKQSCHLLRWRCHELNAYVPPNSYVEILIPNVMVLGCGDLGN